MKKLGIGWLIAMSLGAGPGPASGQDAPGTYTNPVYKRDFPDPFVLAHGGRYYAYATQTRGTGFQLMESTDLTHWTPRPLEFPIPWAREHYWAPEVFERAGTFYLTYSALDPDSKKHHVAVATAESPLGPFRHRAILVRGDDNKVGVIDATIAVDEKDRPYLIYSEETPRRIVARPLNADLLGVAPEITEVIRPDLDWERGVTEAPTIFKRGGIYHLFYSGGPYEGVKDGPRYAVGHASARSLLGPYTKTPAPILASVEGKVYGPGHQCVVTAPDGSDWLLYHGWDAVGQPRYGQNPSGRTLRIDRIEWQGQAPRVVGPTLTPRPAPATVRKPATKAALLRPEETQADRPAP